jgi:hypothetical protein
MRGVARNRRGTNSPAIALKPHIHSQETLETLMRKLSILAVAAATIGLGACASRTDNTVAGAAAGGVAGAAVAGPVGAAVGAVAGGVVGNNTRPTRRYVRRPVISSR